jgi:hypothetical protein
MIVVRVGNLGFPLHNETWTFHLERILGFPVGTNLRVSNRLSVSGGTSWADNWR